MWQHDAMETLRHAARFSCPIFQGINRGVGTVFYASLEMEVCVCLIDRLLEPEHLSTAIGCQLVPDSLSMPDRSSELLDNTGGS